MRWEIAKAASAVKLKGVELEFDMVEKTLKAVVIRDMAGNICRVALEDYNCLRCLIPADPTMEKRHVLHGTTPLGKFREAFENKWDAEQRQREVDEMFLFRKDVDLKIECAEVEVDETGEPKADALPDIPF